jgi:predicted DCC family thiol-disulfide oxidoreductase YuxK
MNADEQAGSVGRASAGRLAILFDGSCEMCRASLDGIRQFDNSG